MLAVCDGSQNVAELSIAVPTGHLANDGAGLALMSSTANSSVGPVVLVIVRVPLCLDYVAEHGGHKGALVEQ